MLPRECRPLITAGSLTAAGLLFIAFPIFRPWGDKDGFTDAGQEASAEAFASAGWLAAHTFGMFAFLLIAIGFCGLRLHLSNNSAERLSGIGAVLSLVGAGLVLPYFGMETFALHYVANHYDASEAVVLADGMREHALAMTLFGLGLIVVAIGAIVMAVAVAKTDAINRWSAFVMAAGITLYLPQFFLPPAGRIIHGLILGLALIWMAWSLWESRSSIKTANVPEN